MASQSNSGRKERSRRNDGRTRRSKASSRGRAAPRRGTSRRARHLNDDVDTGDARDEDFDDRENDGFEGIHKKDHFGEVRRGDVSGFGRPLSFQGEGFFGYGVPFEQSTPHTGTGNAVGYGPGRQSSRGLRGKDVRPIESES